MAVVNGAAPTSQTRSFAGWGNYTFVDRSVSLPVGQITALGAYAPGSWSGRLWVAREISPTNYEFVASVVLGHSATEGYEDALLSFTVPAGTYRLACTVLAGVSTQSLPVARATKFQNVSAGSVDGFYADTGTVPPLRATYEGEPPDPSKHVVAGLGQSNCVRLFSEGGSAMQAACPVTLRLVSAAVNSTSLTSWLPGSENLNNAIAAYNAAMQEADTGHGAFILYRGENESSVQADAAAMPELWRSIVDAFRAGVGKADLPVIIPVLFAKPTDNRPYWASVQGSQIAMTTPHMAGLIPFSHGVSFADLVGTLDDGVHMAPAQNATAGTRVGQLLAAIL